MSSYEMGNLVFLVYASNTCFTNVVSELPEGLEVDVGAGSWTFDGETFKIGEMRECEWGSEWGVIGVFDRTSDEHLNSMVSAANEAWAGY